MALIDLANPTRFLALAERLLPWLIGATVIAFALGLQQSYGAPDDYQQGATVKIMFIHVPSAWLGMFGWAVMSIGRARHAGVAASARRRRRQGRRPDRRGVHLPLPRHRLAVGPADVGHLLGVGCAADVGADPVPDVSRRRSRCGAPSRTLPARRAPPRC